jgi:hypothetical protein
VHYIPNIDTKASWHETPENHPLVEITKWPIGINRDSPKLPVLESGFLASLDGPALVGATLTDL